MAVQSVPDVTDERLVQAVLDGDRDAFGDLVERYKRGIASFIGASVRQPSDVADLTQETFLRAFAHLGTFNPELGRFSTWLYHIARNVVRTFLGRSLRRPALAELGEEQTLENTLPDQSREADPAGGVLRAEAEAEVRAALAELPANFTFATMAEVRSLPRPHVSRAPVFAYLVSYLIAAWLLIGGGFLLAPSATFAVAESTLDASGQLVRTFGAVGHAGARLFG